MRAQVKEQFRDGGGFCPGGKGQDTGQEQPGTKWQDCKLRATGEFAAWASSQSTVLQGLERGRVDKFGIGVRGDPDTSPGLFLRETKQTWK